VTAVDDCDGHPCAHPFLAAALGRLLLEVLCHGDGTYLAFPPASPRPSSASPRASSPLKQDHVADTLRRLEEVGTEQTMGGSQDKTDDTHPVRLRLV
jgi:hypothetical protein